MTWVFPDWASAVMRPRYRNAVRPCSYPARVEYDALRRGVAEFVGTFALIFIGMGSIVFAGPTGLVGVALAHGLTIAIMASAVGHISGGHFNPAVTFGFLVTRRIAPSLAAVYWAAQLAGALLGALALRATFPDEANLDGGVPVLNETIGAGSGLLLEAILTFFLVWVIFAPPPIPAARSSRSPAWRSASRSRSTSLRPAR